MLRYCKPATVTWDCAVPDSQVAASNGASSGTIESAGFSVKGNGKTLDSGKETTFKAGEAVTFEIKGNSDETSPYAWSIKASLIDGYLDCGGGLQLGKASLSAGGHQIHALRVKTIRLMRLSRRF